MADERGVINGAMWVWVFRLIVATALAAGVADRVRIGSVLDDARQDIRELQTQVRIYHFGGEDNP